MRNLDAFLNIASNACLIARLFVQSLVMSDPHHNYEKKAGSLWSNLDGGLPLGILCCYGWHTGASCFLHRLSGNRRDSGGTFDFWRTNTASGEWAAEPVFSSVSMTRNESKRCTAQWVTGGNWDSSQSERDGMEQNRTGCWLSATLVQSSFVCVYYGEWFYCFFWSMESKQASRQRMLKSSKDYLTQVKVSQIVN